jgi:hypothetical protein
VANGFSLEALGSRFVVTCASAPDAAVLQQQWSRLAAKGTGLPIDLRWIPVDQQGRALLSEVTSRAIEAAAGTRLMLHAAGIADGDGLVIALVGPSGMGKTTAASYLCRHGFGYVTDETVSIGPEGDVLPFGRPLSLRRPGGEVQRSPDALGMGVPSGDLSIARIVLLDRVPGHADSPTLTAVPLVDALLELIPQTSALATLPDPVQLMSRTIDRCGGVLRLTYGEMDERVRSLMSELLGRQVEPHDPWHAFVPPPCSDGVASRRSASVDDQELFQGNVLDGVATDGEALVLVGHVPVRLGEIGVAIWEAARDGVDPSEIVSMVEREHGAHPDAPRIVHEAVDQMLTAALLVAGAGELPIAPAASR